MSVDKASRDAGFTLPEVMIALTISAIIGSAVVSAIVLGLRTDHATVNRLANSHNAQLASAYFVTDVQTADLIDVSSSDTTCGGVSPVVRFRWTMRDTFPPSTVRAVAYRLNNGGVDLERVSCSGAGAGDAADFTAASTVSTLRILHNLDPAVPPTVTCSYDVAPTAPDDCTGSTEAHPAVSVKLAALSQIAENARDVDTVNIVLESETRSRP